MSILTTIQNLNKSFGTQTLFQDISFGLFEKEKLGLIGPNGTGKSTLLKIIAGLEDLDEGTITYKKGVRLVYLAQTHIRRLVTSGQKGTPTFCLIMSLIFERIMRLVKL